MADRAYRDPAYLAAKARLRGAPCHFCGAPSTTVDHQPPVASFANRAEWVGRLLPACKPCNSADGARFRLTRRAGRVSTPSRRW